MKKLILVVLVIVIAGVAIMAIKKPINSTKIPYNNGFYAGAYNPELPVIDPTAPGK